ncbi:hypothetical protein CEP48_08640 [Mergibacter septicus]|uniref:Uncharacterized protein n=1 Tax=Mergibacter septicus TaxID=221402 RepID=A0A8E3MHU9_9PAST|nr:hypothetical protein [Mergibacter septicus]AWX16228.1 hypothetical protein CEP47_08635 [Mergibacter septicus]QDJ13687.1 hypothetical protein CEP45_07435 [Mergibacter septicus]QDJ15480.1 hypothetical protein CEP48_08640 [Mergibacter septicus]UTU48650.1 hypothetical protein HLL31_07795 [Mergibacter septicus]WMR95720.1 hypothetical protein RDJ12_07215 [Mergibacter septicus]
MLVRSFNTTGHKLGITLVEVMLSLGLSSLLLLSISHLISYHYQRLTYLYTQLELQLVIHKVAELIGKDLQRSGFNPSSKAKMIADQEKDTLSLELPKSIDRTAYQCVLFNYQATSFGYRFDSRNIRTFDSREGVIPTCQQQNLYWKRLIDDRYYQITDFSLEPIQGAKHRGIRLKIVAKLKHKLAFIYEFESIIPLLNQ